MILKRLKTDYIEWQITRRLPLWAFVIMVIYWALCGFGLTKGIAQ